VRRVFQLSLAAVLLISLAYAGNEEVVSLQKARDLFGAPVLGEKALFAINKKYVIQFSFKGHRLAFAHVLPRYEVEKNLWDESWDRETNPYWLTEEEAKAVLGRLDLIKSRGNLKEKYEIVPTTGIHWLIQDSKEAEQKTVAYLPYNDKAQEQAPPRIRSIDVAYKKK